MLVKKTKGLLLNKLVAETPLNELGEVFRILVERLYAHRKINNGFTPKEIFEQCVGMSGMSVSVQIINEVIDGTGGHMRHIGYALKRRDDAELGDAWAGL